LRSAAQFSVGDNFQLRVVDGRLKCRVEEIAVEPVVEGI
jgi:hypothetical protein